MDKKNKKIICVIPARLASMRFPNKMLSFLGGRPLLFVVWKAALESKMFDEVLFAIDHQKIADVINSFGGNYFMTSPSCDSGVARLVELMTNGKVKADIWVNWQGDEPFISRPMIESLLQSCDNLTEEIWTLKKQITNPHEIFSPNIAKVITNQQGFACYFSRAPIPYFRDESDPEVLIRKNVYFKHVGLYAYSTQALQKIALMSPCATEDAEKLEQLRFLHYGINIRVHQTEYEVRGIDTPEDLIAAEERIRRK